MSALYVLALIAIWMWITRLLWKVGGRFLGSGYVPVAVRIVLIVVVAAVWFGWSFWEVAGKKMYWDAKVRELCATDGGVRVYETVELPTEMFNKWGQPNFYRPDQGEDALGPEYLVKVETRFLRKENENPVIMRFQNQVIRQSDGKLLAESISYTRRGGDLPGPWHPSSYRCPEHSKDVLDEIFVKPKSIEGRK